MSDYRLTTLPNGLRIASIEMPHMRSVSLGFWAGVGGRYEAKSECGISHFTEHLLFKGTGRRSARKITEAVEGVGGYLNAFTTEDHTCYYAKSAARHLPILCDVLSDMYCHSLFSPTEIKREREVIEEEILMVRDSPSQHVQELLSEALWPDQPLGRPLTGCEKSIARMERDDFTAFTQKAYTGRNTVVSVAGPVTHECAVELLRPALEGIPAGRRLRYAKSKLPVGARAKSAIVLYPQEIEQTHLAIGLHAFGRHDERRFSLKLLSVILGENMSSRLFQKLRERHGLCYSVHSGLVALEDSGALTLFAALDADKMERALKMILGEIRRLVERPPSRTELRNAQDYTIGQTVMGLESTTNQMMWMGESLLSTPEVADPLEVERRLLEVTPAQIQAVAKDCFTPERLAVALAGEVPDRSKIEEWLRW